MSSFCVSLKEKKTVNQLYWDSLHEREVGVIDLEPTPSLPTPLMHNYKLGGREGTGIFLSPRCFIATL